MCVFPALFSNRETEDKLLVILLVLYCLELGLLDLCLQSDLCHFCATLSFQKIKETSKEEQSYANKTGFCSAPKKDTERSQTSQG